MSIGEVVGFVAFLAIGYVPLWFAWRARRRWVRVVLALVATVCLPLIGSLFLLAGSGDSIQGGPIPIVMMLLACVCGLSALVALVLAFVPVRQPDY